MVANPCKCGSSQLKASFDGSTGEKWVVCDKCGNSSDSVTGKNEDVVAQWNLENEKEISELNPT